jgi:hypothetical protein
MFVTSLSVLDMGPLRAHAVTWTQDAAEGLVPVVGRPEASIRLGLAGEQREHHDRRLEPHDGASPAARDDIAAVRLRVIAKLVLKINN